MMTLDFERHLPNGFAAGCEAVALPRRERPSHFLRGSAPYLTPLLLVYPAEHQTRGRSPQTYKPRDTAGPSPASHQAAKPDPKTLQDGGSFAQS